MQRSEIFRQMRELGFEWDGKGEDDATGRFTSPEHPEYGKFTVQTAGARLGLPVAVAREEKPAA